MELLTFSTGTSCPYTWDNNSEDHVWLEDGQRILYNGRIVKMKAKGSSCVASHVSVFELAAVFICYVFNFIVLN